MGFIFVERFEKSKKFYKCVTTVPYVTTVIFVTTVTAFTIEATGATIRKGPASQPQSTLSS